MINRDTVGTDATCEKCSPGFYNDIPGNETCKNCPIGHYQNEEGIPYCIGCIPGQYQNQTGANICEICVLGKFQNLPRETACVDCPTGSVNSGSGSTGCNVVPLGSKINSSNPSGFVACPAGTKGNIPPNETCTKCLAGESSAAGATTCQPCDKGKFSSALGSICQDCPAGTFQDQNTNPSTSCKTCPTGYNNTVTGESSCQDLGFKKTSDCNEFQYLNDTSTDPTDWACVECPLGASCDGNINWYGVQAKFGWSRCHNNDSVFERCTFPGACLGGTNPALMGKFYSDEPKKNDLADCNTNSNCTARCNTAYVNASMLCGQCAFDYSHDGLTGRCDRCPPLGENIGVAVVGGLLGLVGLTVFIQITLSDGGRLDESDGAKSIGLSFIQLISLLVTFPIAW